MSVHHLEFVAVTAQAMGDWRSRRAPLGMSPALFRGFREQLFDAIALDKLSDFDVRLKGSAAAIFSGLHKRLPANRAELADAYKKAYGVPPQPTIQNTMDVKREQLWALQPYPRRRPFDSMYKLGTDPELSDLDIQISSSDVETQCRTIYSSHRYGSVPNNSPMIHPTYGFLTSSIVSQVIPEIKFWADQWTLTLGRSVNVKAFPGSGPPNVTAKFGELSSHYRANDWMIVMPQAGDY